LDPVQA